MSKRPEIFVSAASGDLRSSRETVKDALLSIGIYPIVEEHFEPDYRTIRALLEGKLESCQAMISLVGFHYGGEPAPDTVPQGQSRRSWTQLEYDIARELGKKVYVFIFSEDYPFDQPSESESEEKQALQVTHRRTLLSGEQIYYEISSPQELATKVRELRDHVQYWQRQTKHSFHWIRYGLAVFIAILAIVAAVNFGIVKRMESLELSVQTIEKLATDTASVSFEEAVEALAQEKGLDKDVLLAKLDALAAETLNDPKASSFEKALAEFQIKRGQTKKAFLIANQDNLERAVAAVNEELGNVYGPGHVALTEYDAWTILYLEMGIGPDGSVDPDHTHSLGEKGLLPIPTNVAFWLNDRDVAVYKGEMSLDENIRTFLRYLGHLKNRKVNTQDGFDLYTGLLRVDGIQGQIEKEARVLSNAISGTFYGALYTDGVPYQDILTAIIEEKSIVPILEKHGYRHAGTLVTNRERNFDDALNLVRDHLNVE